jgi:DNA repair exonuclease SbcCD nuclease subunit
VAHGYDYWALGHVHQRAVHAEHPHVVMPGMPQGRDIGEAGAKSATLVTVSDEGVSLEERVTSEVQFDRVSCGLDGVGDWREAGQRMAVALRDSADVASEHAVVRLRLEGATPLAWRLRRDLDLLTEQTAEEARATGRVWLEKIELGVRPPLAAAEWQGDARAELGRIMADLAGEAAFLARAGEAVEALVADLPPELRGIFGDTAEEREAALAQLVDEGVTEMSARLIGAGGHGEEET